VNLPTALYNGSFVEEYLQYDRTKKMKFINISFFIGALGLLFCLFVAFQNPSAPVLQMIALGFLFSTLFITGFLGEQIRRK